MSTIYLFACDWYQNGDTGGMALAEDGHVLAEHVSSSETWLKHDLGLTSDWKHEAYRAHYPDGFNLQWIDDPDNHAGYIEAVAKNHLLPASID